MCPLPLPEDLASVAAKFDTPEALARAYAALESKLGTTIPVPTNEEQTSALMERLGAPTDAASYEVPLGVEEETIKNLRTFAVAAKLTPAQFATMAKAEQAKVNATVNSNSEAIGKVRSEYGDGFDAAQARVVRALQSLGDRAPEYDASDPSTFRLLEQMGTALQGPGGSPGSTPQATPASAMDVGPAPMKLASEARAVLSSEAYNDRLHIEHETAKDAYAEKLLQLMQAGFNGCYDPRLEEKRLW